MGIKKATFLFLIMLSALLFGGCNQPYSQNAFGTGTSLPPNDALFATIAANSTVVANTRRSIFGSQTAVSGIIPNATPSIGAPELVATQTALANQLPSDPTNNNIIQFIQYELKNINWPDIDWYHLPLIGWILTQIRNLGGEGLVVAFVSVVITLFFTNLKRMILGIYKFFVASWKFIQRQNKYYVFDQSYLDWLIGQYRHLGLLPAQVVARRWGERQQFVDLEQIYVRLSLSSQADDQEWIIDSQVRNRWGRKRGEVIQFVKSIMRTFSAFSFTFQNVKIDFSNLTKTADRFFPETPYIPGSLSLIIDRTPRLILKGEPGSGKTTLLRYLAVTCARALRNNRDEGDTKFIVWQRLSWKTKPFPIVVRLSRHGDVQTWKDQKNLIDAMKEEMPLDLRRQCPADFFEKQLKRRSCLILLDAFDELGSPKARAVMAEYIQGFLEIHGKLKHRFVVTTRIIGYEGQLNSVGFFARTVQPLEKHERKLLIKHRYKAISAVEKIGRTQAEARGIDIHLQEREHSLIERLESLPRLAQLATNPMLLSLITLVHFLKVELPDERVLLYRDCVEILTEKWQRYKRDEMGFGSFSEHDLTLSQKVVLLSELAFEMQQRRDPDSNLALLPKKDAVLIIAKTFDEQLGDDSEKDELFRKAENWVMGIQSDSGIIIEQGLDSDGEPLIGFSHLTFQEYLAAVAIKENMSNYRILLKNLLNPSWHEVIRLYVVLSDDSTTVVRYLAEHAQQPMGLLMACWCITERVRKIDSNLQKSIVDRLMQVFLSSDDHLEEISAIMESISETVGVVPFLLEQINAKNVKRQVAAIHALKGMSLTYREIENVRDQLVRILDLDFPIDVRIAARETLSRIGDPRFSNLEPVLLLVPAQPYTNIKVMPISVFVKKLFSELRKENVDISELARYCSRHIYAFWRKKIFHTSNFTDAFYISRYPITNIEYSKFVYETGRRSPFSWHSNVNPTEMSSHPVTSIYYFDAIAYCNWLSKKTGYKYRLPTELEWEIGGGLLEGFAYPWGDEFDPSRCNTRESGIKSTTPVGTYFDTKSIFGLQDVIGNVREFTRVNIPLRVLVFCILILMLFSIGWGWALLIGFGLLSMFLFTAEKGGSYIHLGESLRIYSKGISSMLDTFPFSGFRVVREVKMENHQSSNPNLRDKK
jgi:hypothetical protein